VLPKQLLETLCHKDKKSLQCLSAKAKSLQLI